MTRFIPYCFILPRFDLFSPARIREGVSRWLVRLHFSAANGLICPFETLYAKAKQFGFDGIELPCWGDHFDVDKALKDKGYCKNRWDILKSHGLKTYAISNHLVGQAVCDNIDERHKLILPEDVWGDGNPAGVQQRAAQKMIDTAKAARALFDAAPEKSPFPVTVNGFTGSSIWHSIYAFPPTSQEYWQKGFDDFAKKWTPILNEFDKVNVRFALEVHPTEIAFDIASAQRAIDAIKGHKASALASPTILRTLAISMSIM